MKAANPFLANPVGNDKVPVKKSFGPVSREEEQSYYEISERVCVYKKPHAAYNLMGNLSTNGLKVLVYLLPRLPKNQDYILINIASIIKYGKLSKASVYKGLKELCVQNLFAKNAEIKSAYWINPHYFFCGNRAQFLMENSPESCIVVK